MLHRRLIRFLPAIALLLTSAGTAWARDSYDHHERDRHRAYDHDQRDRHEAYDHYGYDRARSFGHAVGDLFRYGTTNPYSSPGHYYRDQHRAYDHYQRDRHRSYDHYRPDAYEAQRHHYEDHAYSYDPYH